MVTAATPAPMETAVLVVLAAVVQSALLEPTGTCRGPMEPTAVSADWAATAAMAVLAA